MDDRTNGPVEFDPEYCDALAALTRDGEKGLGPFIAKYRRSAIAKANAGDLTELASLIRAGTDLNEDEREFVAKYLEGEIPITKGAPKNHDLTLRICLAHFWLVEVDGLKYEAAVSEIMALVKRSRSTVADRIMAGRKCAITQDQLKTLRVGVKFCPPEVANYFRQIHLESG